MCARLDRGQRVDRDPWGALNQAEGEQKNPFYSAMVNVRLIFYIEGRYQLLFFGNIKNYVRQIGGTL